MNKNIRKNYYDTGEIVFGIDSPGSSWVKLDGSVVKVDSNFSNKLSNSSLANLKFLNDGSGLNICAVAYGNGVWVAGGASGVLRTSTDELNWNTQTSQFGSSTIFSIAYGNGTFVAVGAGTALRTSENGITWTTRTSTFFTAICAVAYGNGAWIAVGSSASVRTSTDNGVTWTTQTSNYSATICSVAYGNGTWVFGGVGGGLRTSTDNGVTWNTQTTLNYLVTGISKIAYGNGIWAVASINADDTIQTSTNLINWSIPKTYTSGQIASYALTYADNKWLLGGINSQGIMISTDALNWNTQISLNNINSIVYDAAYGNNAWVVVGLGVIATTKILTTFKTPNTYLGNGVYGWMKIK
jgi:hypothetical protein